MISLNVISILGALGSAAGGCLVFLCPGYIDFLMIGSPTRSMWLAKTETQKRRSLRLFGQIMLIQAVFFASLPWAFDLMTASFMKMGENVLSHLGEN